MDKLINDFFNDPINKDISKCINERVLSYTLTENTSSLIMKWIKAGIIDDTRTKEHPKHKFSLIETIWVNTIAELKSFGMTHEQIKKVRENLLISSKDLPVPYPYLEFHLINTILYGKPYFIIIDKKGEPTIVSVEMHNQLLCLNEEIASHIIISLNGLFKTIIKRIDHSKKEFGELFSHSEAELELLAFVKNGEFKTIEITRKNGDVDKFNHSCIETNIQILSILNKGDYKKIDITQDDGHIKSIINSITKK